MAKLKAPTFEKVKGEYESLFAGASIKSQNRPEVVAVARRILSNQQRYATVSQQTSVPWWVIGLIHNMECSLSFEKHLHNGDPLDEPTVRVPAGRGPFSSWEESAVDALKLDGLHKIDWSKDVVARVAYMAEKFNGWGYRRESIDIPSPYLWSFTTAYEKGKFISDGKYSAVAVSKQAGVMAILKALMEVAPDLLAIKNPEPVKEFPKAVVEEKKVSPIKVIAHSRSIPLMISVVFAKIAEWFFGITGWISDRLGDVVDIITKSGSEVDNVMSPLASLAGALKVNLGSITFWLTVGIIAVCAFRVFGNKTTIEKLGDN